ncbi:MAG: ribose-phosphate diphosphokinase [Gammaproteobacteria bacterium]|nr:ribose-phosphate diphosphokinase [Gammaproteobacteria bacterium]
MVIGFPEYAAQAQQFAMAAGLPYVTVNRHRFPDAESKLQLPENLPVHVIFYCSLDKPNDKLIELILAAAGARSLGARSVSLVAPYLCYMRQDKAFQAGEVVSQKVIGQLLADYFDSVLTVDAHLHRIHKLSDAIPAQQAINITATDPMAHFLQQSIEQPYLMGPDGESEQWVADIATHYQMDYGVAVKERYGDREVNVRVPEGNYEGRNIILLDDIASTGKTLIGAAKALMKYHPASLSVLVTHALFVNDSVAQLKKAGINNIWSCDSIVHPTNAVKLADILALNFKSCLAN